MPKNSKCLLVLLLAAVLSCKQNENSNKSRIASIIDTNKNKPFTLAQMQEKNGKLIDSVQKRILEQVQKNNFEQLLADADTSLSAAISPKDLHMYSDMVTKLYGNLDSIHFFSHEMTAEAKEITNTAHFSSGDSLELNFVLLLSNSDAKLSYITFGVFKKDTLVKRLLPVAQPTIASLQEKKYDMLFVNCTQHFKQKSNTNAIKALWEKHFAKNSGGITHLMCRPLIFAKGKIGIKAEFVKQSDNNMPTEVNLIYLYQESGKLQLEDVLIKKQESRQGMH